MAGATLNKVAEGIAQQIEGYQDRARSVERYFVKVLVPLYQNAQARRFRTQNTSEGTRWDKLDARYDKWKRVKYRGYPGSGTKMLIATTRLAQGLGILGKSSEFRVVTTPRSIVISTVVEYARHVDEARTFTKWSAKTLQEIRRGVANYIVRNTRQVDRAN